MCSGIFHTRCGVLGTCVSGPIWFSCENLGDRCLTCSDALLGGDEPAHGALIYNEYGEFACWLIKKPGSSGLQPFDAVTEINGVNADVFFDQHYSPTGAALFVLTVYRDGQEGCLTVTRK